MKFVYFLSLMFLIQATVHSQNSKKITVAYGNSISDVVSFKELYSYPEFIEGKVLFKDGTAYAPKLNYNLFLGQIQFINPKGDTLVLNNENTLKYILIGQDSFFYDKGYFRVLTGFSKMKLGVQQRIKVADKQKIGAFGQPSSGAGIETYDRIVQTNQLSLMENIILSKETKYYIGNTNNEFYPCSKKRLFAIFPKHQEVIESYVRENQTNFNKQEDLIKLLGFLENLSS
ncbi:MAG TPA: hypothetical protein VF540_13395 [Segetibacter sp.]